MNTLTKSRNQVKILRKAFARRDAAPAKSLLREASADSIEILKRDYRKEVGRDLEFDMRGLSPVPKITFGPGFRVNFGDGLKGEELQETLDLLHTPQAVEKAGKLYSILGDGVLEPEESKTMYGLLWDAGGEERERVSEQYKESTGRDLFEDMKPVMKQAIGYNDSQPLPSTAEKRVAVVVSSGNWKNRLEGKEQENIGGYHWREIEAYVKEAQERGYEPVIFTPDGLPASPDQLSLLQGKITPKFGYGLLPGTGPESRQGQAIVEGLRAPRSLASFRAEDFKTMHIAGGHGSHHDLVGNPELESAAKALNESGKLVTAVCHATPALGDLLEGEKATGFSPQYDSALLRAGYVLPEFDPPYNAHEGLRDLGAEVSTLKAFNIHHTERFEKNGVPVITGTGPEATDNVARKAFDYLGETAD